MSHTAQPYKRTYLGTCITQLNAVQREPHTDNSVIYNTAQSVIPKVNASNGGGHNTDGSANVCRV